MPKKNLIKYFKTSHEIFRLAVMYYVGYSLSFRQVENMLHERGTDVSYEAVRVWVEGFVLLKKSSDVSDFTASTF